MYNLISCKNWDQLRAICRPLMAQTILTIEARNMMTSSLPKTTKLGMKYRYGSYLSIHEPLK